MVVAPPSTDAQVIAGTILGISWNGHRCFQETLVNYTTSQCIICDRLFEHHEKLVHTTFLRSKGKRGPVCLPCVENFNKISEARGGPKILLWPGAYPEMDGK